MFGEGFKSFAKVLVDLFESSILINCKTGTLQNPIDKCFWIRRIGNRINGYQVHVLDNTIIISFTQLSKRTGGHTDLDTIIDEGTKDLTSWCLENFSFSDKIIINFR